MLSLLLPLLLPLLLAVEVERLGSGPLLGLVVQLGSVEELPKARRAWLPINVKPF